MAAALWLTNCSRSSLSRSGLSSPGVGVGADVTNSGATLAPLSVIGSTSMAAPSPAQAKIESAASR